jgi:hypothetical protein
MNKECDGELYKIDVMVSEGKITSWRDTVRLRRRARETKNHFLTRCKNKVGVKSQVKWEPWGWHTWCQFENLSIFVDYA